MGPGRRGSDRPRRRPAGGGGHLALVPASFPGGAAGQGGHDGGDDGDDHTRDAIRRRDDLIADVLHALRNPLAPLYMQIHALTRQARTTAAGGDPATLLARVEQLQASANRYLRTLDRLQDLGSGATGVLNLDREEVDLGALVRGVAAELAGEARAAGVQLRLDLDGAVGHWDRARLENVCFRLLSNAIRFGGGQPVDVTVRAGARRVYLVVRDGGVGIPEAELATLFEGLERPRRRGRGGLGVGLWLAHRLVTAHDGELTVESELGRGSTFTVALPPA